MIKTTKIALSLLPLFIFIMSYAQKKEDFSTGGLEKKLVTTYWDKDSTRMRSRGYYNVSGFSDLGQKTGKWTYWYYNGEVSESSTYVNGKYHGKLTQLYENGKPMNVGYFKYGIEDSLYTGYYENGTIAIKGFYAPVADSILLAPHKYWAKLDYIEPVKIGEWHYYYENGKPKKTVEFKPNDTTEYLKSFWDKDGNQTVINGNGVVKEYYATKKPKLETTYTNGLPNGKYTEWNANGTVRVEGKYKNGLKEGEWKLWNFTSHTLYQLTNYKQGEKHGLFKEYTPDEILVIKGNYLEGEKDGIWEYYFENGAKDMIGGFKHDMQHGHWDYWYPNGQLYYEGSFVNGKKEGEWNFYYKTGEKWKSGHYQNDKKEGLWTTWYENGQEAFEGKYENGKEQGVWTSWYENGVMKDRGTFDAGKMNQTWTGWYPNDQKRYEGTYTNDLKDGKWSFWNDKGVLKDVGYFKALKKPRGKKAILIETNTPELQSYKHGKWVSYDEKGGAIASEGTYSYGKQTGVWRFYYPGGKIVATENSFKDGKLDGVSKTFTRRGKPQTEIGYKNGVKHGEMKIYDSKGRKLIAHKLYKNGKFKKDLLKRE